MHNESICSEITITNVEGSALYRLRCALDNVQKALMSHLHHCRDENWIMFVLHATHSDSRQVLRWMFACQKITQPPPCKCVIAFVAGVIPVFATFFHPISLQVWFTLNGCPALLQGIAIDGLLEKSCDVGNIGHIPLSRLFSPSMKPATRCLFHRPKILFIHLFWIGLSMEQSIEARPELESVRC